LDERAGHLTASQDLPQTGFSFGEFRLEPDGTLFRGSAAIHLPPKELAALRILLAHAGQIVSPAQLRKELWRDTHVTDESIPKCLSSLRTRLAPEECIQTVYKRGYRFSAEVRGHSSRGAQTAPRLAIVPFECGFGFPEHLALAVVEETADRFVNLHPAPVSVIARDSVFTLAAGGRTAQQIGEALGAALVLKGTLRALPAHFRLRARMIRVEDGTEIWIEDLLVERSQAAMLAKELVERLAFRLGSGRLSLAAEAAPVRDTDYSPQHREAYDLYRRARFELQTFERHRMQDSLQHLLRATELDPSLTSAQVSLAHLCCAQAMLGYMSPMVAAENVRRAAESVPDDSEFAEAILPALGWVHFHVDRNLSAAIQSFSCCAHLPHDSWAVRLRVMFALSRHRWEEAIALLEDALRVDPYSPWLHARLAWAFHLAGEGRKSMEQVDRVLQMFPGDDGSALYGATIFSFHGERERGMKLAEELAKAHPYFDLAAAVHAYTLANAGRSDEARAILERLQWLGRERFVNRSFTPAAYLALGNRDAAVEELLAAEQSRCPWFFQMLADPRLQTLKDHSEFGRMEMILAEMEAVAAPGSLTYGNS
jgi:DNA-binding winged helix-turn-helix (wHTH) protein/tetratricopeptide (TPR) repeat protein